MPVNTVVNAVYYRMVLELSRLAEIAGESGEAARYRALADSLYSIVNERLWDPDGRRYVGRARRKRSGRNPCVLAFKRICACDGIDAGRAGPGCP